MADCHCFMPAPTKFWIIVAFAALYLIWGSTYLGIRFAIETIPPFLMAGTRFLLGGNGGVTISEKYIDSGLAAVIVTIVPIYIVVLGWATGTASRPTAVVWLGLLGGFAGVGILLSPALRFSPNDAHRPVIGMSIL